MKKLIIEILKKWFIDCNHRWVLLVRCSVMDKDNLDREIPKGYSYTYRCRKCCESKTIKI